MSHLASWASEINCDSKNEPKPESKNEPKNKTIKNNNIKRNVLQRPAINKRRNNIDATKMNELQDMNDNNGLQL